MLLFFAACATPETRPAVEPAVGGFSMVAFDAGTLPAQSERRRSTVLKEIIPPLAGSTVERVAQFETGNFPSGWGACGYITENNIRKLTYIYSEAMPANSIVAEVRIWNELLDCYATTEVAIHDQSRVFRF
jgi:hypothetical protein